MTQEDVKKTLDKAKEQMAKAVDYLESTLALIRAGKADVRVLDNVTVEYYGSPMSLAQVANVTVPDARTIKIQPWEKKMFDVIEKAILCSNLGFNPSNNGESIIIAVPPLTEERRRDLVKQAKAECESTRVVLRNVRKDANEAFKKMKKDGLSEDLAKDAENETQKLLDSFSKHIDDLLKKKEADIMAI
ncbi:MAG: ribosome recycling factor [Salinivirgaceae bacterium]|nr:ribosome recycling factor [Salinivirgaceae bacterium]